MMMMKLLGAYPYLNYKVYCQSQQTWVCLFFSNILNISGLYADCMVRVMWKMRLPCMSSCWLDHPVAATTTCELGLAVFAIFRHKLTHCHLQGIKIYLSMLYIALYWVCTGQSVRGLQFSSNYVLHSVSPIATLCRPCC